MLKAYIVACVLSFVAGLMAYWLIAVRSAAKRRKRRQLGGGQAPQKESFINRFGIMNLILVIIGVSTFFFVLKMINLFELYGCLPDALITCYFAVIGGECGIMGWIKTTQEKKQERQWLIEDQKKAEKAKEMTDNTPIEMEDASNV